MKSVAFIFGALLLIGNAESLIELQQTTSAQTFGYNAWMIVSTFAGIVFMIWAVKKPSKQE